MIPWPYGPGDGFIVVFTLLHLFAVPVLVLWLGRYTPPLLALRTDVSYGTYLYAWPVQQVMVATAAQNGWKLHPLILFPFALAGTLLLAWASWLIIERPALRLKNFDLRRRRGHGKGLPVEKLWRCMAATSTSPPSGRVTLTAGNMRDSGCSKD